MGDGYGSNRMHVSDCCLPDDVEVPTACLPACDCQPAALPLLSCSVRPSGPSNASSSSPLPLFLRRRASTVSTLAGTDGTAATSR